MPTIIYSADGFPAAFGQGLLGTKQLSVSWPEIIWAAISVGRGGLSHLTQHGVFSAFEITYRAALIYANLREGPDGIVSR